MSAPSLITVDGHKYMSTKSAADLWDLSPKTISDYCKDDKIRNKFKNGRFGWYIRTDEIKPLSQKDIHKLLVFTLQLKNDSTYEIDWTLFNYDESVFESIYQHLLARGYIRPFSISDKKRIPYEVVLTQKGMEIATNFKKEKISNLSVAITQWLPVVIGAAQLYFQINPIT